MIYKIEMHLRIKALYSIIAIHLISPQNIALSISLCTIAMPFNTRFIDS